MSTFAVQALTLGTSIAIASFDLLTTLYIAYAVAQACIERRASLALRWLGVLVVGAALLTLFFHVLLALHAFDRANTSLLLVAVAIATHSAGYSPRRFARELARDARGMGRLGRTLARSPVRWIYTIYALFAAGTVARSLLLPPSAWDSLTYHYPKAALWVQAGGPIELRAPGGWSIYKHRMGGGEIFSAWAMLPFRSDVVVGAVDAFFWFGAALALIALASEFGVRGRHRWAAACYFLFVPAVWVPIGSGYVDAALVCFLIAGLVFAIRFLRCGRAPFASLALVAFALAAGTKLTGVAVLAFAGPTFVALTLRRSGRLVGRDLCAFAVGALSVVVLLGPWIARNLWAEGYPLALPLRIAGVALGPSLPALDWYMSALEGTPYRFATEWPALARCFRLPNGKGLHLGVTTLLPLALWIVGGLCRGSGRQGIRGAGWLVAAVVAGLLAGFYAPGFSVVRLHPSWSLLNGRFLVAVALIACALSYCAFASTSVWRDRLAGYFLVSGLAHLAFLAPRGLSTEAATWIAGAAISFGVGLGVAVGVPRTRRLIACSALVAFLGIPAAVLAIRGGNARDRWLSENVTINRVPMEWLPAARALDLPTASHRIAVTAGANREAHNWFLYYFLGSELQNTLHYVPVSQDGRHLPFGPSQSRARNASFEHWKERLAEQRIEYVMSFRPASIELFWMNEHPHEFQLIAPEVAGDGSRAGSDWGLYRVLPRASARTRRQRGSRSRCPR